MQIVTPSGEASYAFVSNPQAAMQEGKPPQYSLTLLWDKDDGRLAKLEKAILEVAVAKFGAKAKAMLDKGQLRNPLRDGEEKEQDDYQGKVFLTARTNDAPDVVDADAEPIMRATDFYSGCKARMDVYLFAYDKAGNRGVGAILNSVQKLDEGERKSGRRSASEAFGALAEEDADLV